MLVAAGLLAAACAPAVKFRARVTDGESGVPLPGAVVTVEKTGMMAATDSTGATPVTLAAPDAELAITRAGYLPTGHTLAPPSRRGDTARPAILLYPDQPRTVLGRVTSAGTGFALCGAEVGVAGTEFRTQTGPGGSYRFDGFPPGPRLLRVGIEGWSPDSARVIALAGETTRVDFSLRDTANEGEARGTVSEAGTGAALAGARVAIPALELAATTDSLGGFLIPRVPVGEHELEVTAPGFRARRFRFRVAKGWSVALDCALERRD